MQITRQADYAIRAVLYLARQEPKKAIATSTIAREMKIPPSFLAKIISQLSIAGLLNTTRGAHGGVTLSRSIHDVSLLEVVEAIDGPILLNDCVGDPGDCQFNGECPLHDIWSDAQGKLVKQLHDTKFGALV
jgi:Rrf2 family protein